MSELVKAYIEETAQGNVPAEQSDEAKAFRAWSWAQKELERIREAVRAEVFADCRVIDWN